MPIGIGAATLIGSGIAAAGNAGSAISAGKMNKKSMKFQEKMFDRTNAYNTPLEQRKRLQAAGLNPNLVYGQSSGGAAGTADQPAKPDYNVPDIGAIGAPIATGVSQYYNLKSIQSGIDVNEARADNIRQNTVNQGIDALTKTINNASGAIDYKTKASLFQNTIDTAKQRLQNLGIEGQYTSNKDARENRITDETVQNLKTQGKILNSEDAIKKIDAHLYKNYGLKPADPYYIRILHNILEKLDLNPFKN